MALRRLCSSSAIPCLGALTSSPVLSRHLRGCPSAPHANETATSPASPSSNRDLPRQTVLYRGPFLLPFRMLVRLKLLQLSGAASIVLPVTLVMNGTELSTFEMLGLVALAGGTAGASGSMWYFSNRFIGQISMNASKPDQLLFSTMDFWGNRQDEDIAIRDIEPPLMDMSRTQMAQVASLPFLPINVSNKRQFYISMRHGDIRDREFLMQILQGRIGEERADRMTDSVDPKSSNQE